MAAANHNGDENDAAKTEGRKAIRSRLSELGDKLERIKAKRAPNDAKRRSNAVGLAYRLTIELVVGLVVGGFIGWWIDQVVGTMPLFLIIFFVLGMAAGVMNVIRTAKQMQADQPVQKHNNAPAAASDSARDDEEN